MRTWPRRPSVRVLTAVVAGGVVLAGTSTAYADLIGNSLDATIDANVESMPLNVGGIAGKTDLYILATPDDSGDKDGDLCNIDAGEAVTFELTPNDTSIATVSPTSVTFTSCAQRFPITVTPGAVVGKTNVLGRTVSNSTGGGWVVSGITFEVNNALAPNTAPTVSVSGVTPGASYAKGQVPAAVCNVVDEEDGSRSFPASLTALAGEWSTDGIGQRFAMCSYVDAGGLQVLSRDGFNVVDTSRPTIARIVSPEAVEGDLGWYRSDVALNWNVGEAQSPTSLSKSGCDPAAITTDQEAQTYTCSASSAGGSHSLTTTIKRDATAPTVTSTLPSGTLGQNGWYTSRVAVTFTGKDVTSGLATAATQTITTSADGEATVSSPEFKDRAGNTTVGAADRTFRIDSKGPNAPEAVVSPAPNAGDWSKDDVKVTFQPAGDQGPSGVATCSAPVLVSTETAGQTSSGTCTDAAGNVSAAKQVRVQLDKTDPSVSQAVVAAGETGTNGWYTSDVAATFSASDGLSGLERSSADQRTTGEGASLEVSSPAFTDAAGNTTAAGAVTRTFKVDKTAPATPAFVGGPTGRHYFGEVPAAPTCTSADATSGLASCVVTGGGSTVGAHSYTATATDHAGNSSTAALPYTVLAWTAKPFTSPIDMSTSTTTVFNTVKGGSTVPAKFEVFAGTRELTDVDAVALSNKRIACLSGAPVDDIETVLSGSTSLKYDTTAGQYQYNWKLPTGAGTCYALTMTADDGSTVTANFKLK